MPTRPRRGKATRKPSRRRARALSPGKLLPGTVTVVNIIPQSLSGETNNDSEPNLTVNPANPAQIAASAFTPNPAGVGNAPIFVSTDSGNTWLLNAIVPSDRITADISIGFGRTSGKLYAGIIPRPIEIVNGDLAPRLKILRTNSFTGATPMKVLKNRRGVGVDQPYVEATTGTSGTTAGKDLVFVGDNDFNQPNGRTATIDHSRKAGASSPGFRTVSIDARGGSGDAPSIRPAIHADGTVYGGFLHMVGGTSWATLRYDVVVVRDDAFAGGTKPFTALVDPSDTLPGRRVALSRLIPFLPDQQGDPGPLGQERIGSHLSIAVDPRAGRSGTVYLAWADRVGATDYTIHVRSSNDRGVTWSPADLLTLTNAVNPALAINSDGTVGFAYQQLTGAFTPGVVTSANRWVTHFRRSADGVNWNDLILATVPANAPPADGLPYLGDYIRVQAVGRDFCGIFSANNTPNPANFPNGVRFQRNHDFALQRLLDVDGVTPVDISIDPFFFRVTP